MSSLKVVQATEDLVEHWQNGSKAVEDFLHLLQTEYAQLPEVKNLQQTLAIYSTKDGVKNDKKDGIKRRFTRKSEKYYLAMPRGHAGGDMGFGRQVPAKKSFWEDEKSSQVCIVLTDIGFRVYDDSVGFRKIIQTDLLKTAPCMSLDERKTLFTEALLTMATNFESYVHKQSSHANVWDDIIGIVLLGCCMPCICPVLVCEAVYDDLVT